MSFRQVVHNENVVRYKKQMKDCFTQFTKKYTQDLLESFYLVQRPADVIKRKHMCAVWFPYTLLDRLQSCLSTSSDLANREKLQDSLKCALQSHFKQVRFSFIF